MIYKITVKTSKNSNGIRIERGMSVEVVTNNITNPVTTNGGQAVVDAFIPNRSLGNRKLLRSIIGRGMALAIKRILLRSTCRIVQCMGTIPAPEGLSFNSI